LTLKTITPEIEKKEMTEIKILEANYE